jgi:hypothetical protein
MKFLLQAVCVWMSVTSVLAQDSTVRRLGIHSLYHPYDIFAGIHYERESGRVQHRFLLSAGLRTAFQRRLYPQFAYQLAFHAVNRKLQAGPFVRANFDLLRFNKSASHGYLYDEELFLGAYFAAGKIAKIRFSAGIGPSVQQNWSTVKSRFVHYFSWNYFGEISWSYAF